MIADSALYSAENLTLMKDIRWRGRVPLTVAQAKQLVSQLSCNEFVESSIEGYKISVHTSNYGGVTQRWLVVSSQSRRQADLRQLEQKLSKSEQEARKKLHSLCKQSFATQSAAIEAADCLSQKLKYHCLSDIQVIKLQPEPNKKASSQVGKFQNICYVIQASLIRDENVIATESRRAGPVCTGN